MTTCKVTAISSYQSEESVGASEVCSFEYVTLPEFLVPDGEEVIKALFGEHGPLSVVIQVLRDLQLSSERRQMHNLETPVFKEADIGYPVVVLLI